MKRIIQIGILFVSLSLFFACGTTKVETPEDEQTVSAPEVSNDKKNEAESKSEADSMTKDDKQLESEGEKKPSKKPKKATSKKQKKIEEKPEEPPTPVIPVFDDWKYMGFGAEVPKEIEEAVKTVPADFIADGFKVYDKDTRNIVIFHVAGINVDQAEGKLEVSVSKDAVVANDLANESAEFSLGDYEAVESGWVRLNLAYFAEKLQAEEEGSENYQTLLKLLDQIYIAYQIYRKK